MFAGLRSSLIASTVVSTVSLLAIIVILPMFFMKIQKSNTLMLTQLYNCHQDSTDIWKQLSHETIRGKRAYGRVDAPRIPLGRCCSCQQGRPGPPGSKGPDGAPGTPGMIGVNGRNGRDGKYVTSEHHNEPACQKCPPAPPGPPGYPGKKGPRGSAGHPGIGGHNGIPGREGPPGPSGVRGPPGEIGMQGPLGDPGKVLNGAPQGQPGRGGKVGARGKPGLQGRDGRPGLEGIAGTRGTQGERGGYGARGPPGPPGPSGTSGRKGTCQHCPTSDRPAKAEDKNGDTESEQEAVEPANRSSESGSEAGYAEEEVLATTSPSQSQTLPQPPAPAPRNNEEVEVPKTINYPDSVAQPSHKHYGDVDDSNFVQPPPLPETPSRSAGEPAGQYSAKQYASKTVVGNGPRSFGYSAEQLSAFAPASFVGTSERSSSPRTFQTNKGYNVQIMGTDSNIGRYGAQPVAATWAQYSGRSSGPSGKFLSPPPVGPNTYA